MTQPMARFIRNVVGRTIEVDGGTGTMWGRCLRVRVRWDVSRPLIQMLCLVFPDAEEPVGVAFR